MEVLKQVKAAFGGALAACLFAVAGLLLCAPTALAYSEAAEVELPVTIAVDGSVPSEPETFEVVLEALDEGAPMPAGAESSSCSIQVQGGTKASFAAISYERPCVWVYQVTQKPGTNALGVYDSTSYKVSASVTKDESGQLVPTIAVHPEGSEQKAAEILFSNYYDEPLPDTGGMPKTGDSAPLIIFGGIACAAIALAVIAMVAQRRQRDR